MVTQRYRLRVIKETILTLDSEREADQILDMLASREVRYGIAENKTFIYTEKEVVNA